MKVGDLVKYRHDEDIGVVMSVGWATGEVQIHWNDGTQGFHLERNLEVINESR
jgi:hypothetical protein